MVAHLSNAANSILIPRLPIYSRRPIVTLPTLTPTATLDSLTLEGDGAEGAPTEKRRKHWYSLKKTSRPRARKHHKNRDELDAHVEHVLKRRAKFRRTMSGLGQFLKTRG